MRIRELGEFRIEHGGRNITPRQDKLRSTLALLSIRRGKTVSQDAIISELWGASPPDRARGTVHTYIYELRRRLAAQDGVPPAAVLSTESHGYVLNDELLASDLDEFEGLCRAADRALTGIDGSPARAGMETASGLLAEALALWTGDPFANVSCGTRLENHAMWLREKKAQVLGTRLRTDLALGRSASLIAELKILTHENPFQEELSELLMLALARSGRRSDALREFGLLRSRLIDELGLEPGPSLQELQRALLSGSVDGTVPPWTAVLADRPGDGHAVKHIWHPPHARRRAGNDPSEWKVNRLRFD